MCILIFVGTNGETYYNSAALVSCVQNFPKARGPIVGILKGFAGLSGAILTQIFAMLLSYTWWCELLIRPASCLSTAFACFWQLYLMGVMILEDLIELSYNVVVVFTMVLLFLLVLPICYSSASDLPL